MYRHSILLITLCFTLFIPTMGQTRTGRVPARPGPASPQKSVEKGGFDFLPAATSSVDVLSDPTLVNAAYGKLLNAIGLAPEKCSKVVEVAIAVPGFLMASTSTAYLIETDSADELIASLEERHTPATAFGSHKIFHLTSAETPLLVRFDQRRLLLGLDAPFSAILAVAGGRQPGLLQAEPVLRPLFAASAQSSGVHFQIVTPEMVQLMRVFFESTGADPVTAQNMLSMKGAAIDSQDKGQCAFMVRIQFSRLGGALDASLFLSIMRFIGGRPAWRQSDMKRTGNLVSLKIDSGSGECSDALVKGRLRVKDQGTDKVWQIDQLSQQNASATKIEVIPADDPNGVATLVLKVKTDGTFSSQDPAAGKETSLVDGKQYILRTYLHYQDNITVTNTEGPDNGCAAAPSTARTSVRDSDPIKIDRKKLSAYTFVDYPLPVALIHGIRSCWEDWNDWDAYLLGDGARQDVTYHKGYIVFTPTYHFIIERHPLSRLETIIARRTDMAKEVTDQLDQDTNGLFKTPPRFYFVAHSNGGVVARMICHTNARWKDRIKSVYALGTPHSGSAFFEIVGEIYYGLSLLQMAKFNEQFPNFNRVPVYAVVGTAQSAEKCGGTQRCDGVVYPQESARGIGTWPLDDAIKPTPLPKLKFTPIVPDGSWQQCEVPLYHSSRLGKPTFQDALGIRTLAPIMFSGAGMIFACSQ
jgi:hypothetical protein